MHQGEGDFKDDILFGFHCHPGISEVAGKSLVAPSEFFANFLLKPSGKLAVGIEEKIVLGEAIANLIGQLDFHK